MPATLEAPNPFADLIPQSQTYGAFSDLVPAGSLTQGAQIAGTEDYGLFHDLVPQSPVAETEKAVAEMPEPTAVLDKMAMNVEKSIPPFHQAMNAARSLAAGAGKYIFAGLQGFEFNRAELLANPVPEMVRPQGDELVLPDGSVMSKEQQDALEKQYHDNLIAQIPDAKAKAEYFRQAAENVDTALYVDPKLAQTIPARIAHAAGSAGVMAAESLIPYAGVPLMVYHGALATEAEAKNAGQTDEQAEAAGVRSAIGLALFGGASKLAALGVAKLLPEGASTLTKFLSQFTGQEVANETSSRAITGWEAAVNAPPGKKIEAALNAMKDETLEQGTLNTVYALAHATRAAKEAPAKPVSESQPQISHETPEIAPATASEPIEQKPAAEVLQPEQQPQGEPNVPESTSMGLGAHAGGDESLGRPGQSERVGSEQPAVQQTPEEAPQVLQEPIGVADAIAEQSIDENGQSTTGIAQRVHESRAAEGRQGPIQPGEGVTAEDMVQRGRELLNAGADPEKIIAGVSAGKAVTGDEMAVLRARHEQFSNATDKAADALRKSPNDSVAKQAYEDAFKNETEFAQRIKPAATEWHKVGQSMQGETQIETGTFTGLRRAFHAMTGRDVTPKEAVKLDKTATKVQKANSAVEKAKSDFNEVVKIATKNTLPKTADELRAHFAAKFKEMLPC